MATHVLQSLQRHETYYITSADLSILVEHVQFRVHRYFFERESLWFKRQLSTPASPGAKPQGSSDSNSFILEDVTPSQFARFCWVFYNPRYSIYDDASVDDWQSILYLSHIWMFPEIKKLAIRELEKRPHEMTPVKRIKLYHATEVDRNLLISRYAALCEREEPLTLEEGTDLGMETTLMIAKGREEIRKERLADGLRSPLTPTISGEEVRVFVRELFKLDPGSPDEEVSSSNFSHEPPPAARGMTPTPSKAKLNGMRQKANGTPTKPAVVTSHQTPTSNAPSTPITMNGQTSGGLVSAYHI
ncbi:hypothetical protein CPB83DRAFT_572075 [Crepidotus variabilis]|uniref:BTB domain-containing protein n=1 Tax=Crepidotus variabilis TaxID=179855 RepID=A0A9P6E9H7_9AGAR|nr:hypothetical protein CPB83DRAFT_572075 [Crepidotus variabilis]